jgi:hypothetical protein
MVPSKGHIRGNGILTREEIIYILREQDPDYLVDVLNITSEELLYYFPDHVTKFIESEYYIDG